MMFSSSNRFDPVFKNNSTLIKLIYANLLVFIGVHLLFLPFWLMNQHINTDEFAYQWLAVPANLSELIYKPWTLISYMFLHVGFMHILFNMITLYFLGQIFVEFLGEKKLWTVYIAGGLSGALFFIFFYNVFPVFQNVLPISRALGASASIMAVVAAVGTYAPNFSIRLLFLGDIKLKYIAIFFFVLDIINMSNSNSGGHIAHIGGAVLGFFFARQLKKGLDITAWVSISINFIKAIFKSNRSGRMKVKYRSKSNNSRRPTDYNSRKKEEQNRVDEILDKISRSGYDSLSKEEKDFLFKASNKN